MCWNDGLDLIGNIFEWEISYFILSNCYGICFCRFVFIFLILKNFLNELCYEKIEILFNFLFLKI